MKITIQKPPSLKTCEKRAQDAFNAWIRWRDMYKGCISCGGPVQEAGHYYAAGLFTAIRFKEMNVNGQCTKCNCFMHGNLIPYREGLIHRYGVQAVKNLDLTSKINRVKKWSRFEFEIIRKEYERKLREEEL